MRNDSVIEVWLDPENPGEPTFCVGGMVDLHKKTGTIGPKAELYKTYNTSSMKEAQQKFLEDLVGLELETDNSFNAEGFD